MGCVCGEEGWYGGCEVLVRTWGNDLLVVSLKYEKAAPHNAEQLVKCDEKPEAPRVFVMVLEVVNC